MMLSYIPFLVFHVICLVHLCNGAPTLNGIDDIHIPSTYLPSYAIVGLSVALIILFVYFMTGCVCCPNKNIKALSYQNGFPVSRLNDSSSLQFENTTEFAIFPPHSTVIDLQPVGSGFPPFDEKVTFEPLPDILPKKFTSGQSVACSSRPAHFSALLKNKVSLHDWFDDPNSNFPREQLQYLQELGCGWFGRVIEGEASQITNNVEKTPVIVKILREDASPSEHLYFLHEVRPYRDLMHPNVVRLLGRCLESDPFLLIMEHSTSDLKSYLIDQQNKDMMNGALLKMVCNIASGIRYMHENGFSHTDLAAHNCFVCEDLNVKVGDYGISFDRYKGDYYCLGDIALPIRWYSPETLVCTDATIETKEITKEANIWAFGVILWEVFEYGKLPYGDMNNEEVIQKVLIEKSVQLSPPTIDFPAKEEICLVMKECWKSASFRPPIGKIETFLSQLYNDKHSHKNTELSFEERWNSLPSKSSERNPSGTDVLSLKFENDFSGKYDLQNSSDGEAFSSFEMSYDMLPKNNISTCLSPSLRVLNGSIDELTENDAFLNSISLNCEKVDTDTLSNISDKDNLPMEDSKNELEVSECISEYVSTAVKDLDLVVESQSLGASRVDHTATFSSIEENNLSSDAPEQFLKENESSVTSDKSDPVEFLQDIMLNSDFSEIENSKNLENEDSVSSARLSNSKENSSVCTENGKGEYEISQKNFNSKSDTFNIFSKENNNIEIFLPNVQIKQVSNQEESNIQSCLKFEEDSSANLEQKKEASVINSNVQQISFVPNIVIHESPSSEVSELVIENHESDSVNSNISHKKSFKFVFKEELEDKSIDAESCKIKENSDEGKDQGLKTALEECLKKSDSSYPLTSTPVKSNDSMSDLVNNSDDIDNDLCSSDNLDEVFHANSETKKDTKSICNKELDPELDRYYSAGSNQNNTNHCSLHTESFIKSPANLNGPNSDKEKESHSSEWETFTTAKSFLNMSNQEDNPSFDCDDFSKHVLQFSCEENSFKNENNNCKIENVVNIENHNKTISPNEKHFVASSTTLFEESDSQLVESPFIQKSGIFVSKNSEIGSNCSVSDEGNNDDQFSSVSLKDVGNQRFKFNDCSYFETKENPVSGKLLELLEDSENFEDLEPSIEEIYAPKTCDISVSKILEISFPDATSNSFVYDSNIRPEFSGNLRPRKLNFNSDKASNKRIGENEMAAMESDCNSSEKMNSSFSSYNEMIVEDLETGEQTIISDNFTNCDDYENSGDSDEILKINTETDEAIIVDSSEALIGFVPSRSIELLQEYEVIPTLNHSFHVDDDKESSDSTNVDPSNSASSSPAATKYTSPCDSPDSAFPSNHHYRNFCLQNQVIEEELTDEIISPSSIHSNVSFSSNEIFMDDERMSQSSESIQQREMYETSILPAVDHVYVDSEDDSKTDVSSSSYSHINDENEIVNIQYMTDIENNKLSDEDVMHSEQPSQSVRWLSDETLDVEKGSVSPVIIEGQEIMAGEFIETCGISVEDITSALNQLEATNHLNGVASNYLSVSQTPSPYSSVESSPCRDTVYTPDFESDSEETASGTSCSSTSGSFECIHNKFKNAVDISKAVDESEASGSSREQSPLKIFSKTWDCHATPTRSVLVTPEKKFSSMRKSVSFHEEDPQVVFEYPPASDSSEDGYPSDGSEEAFNQNIDYLKYADWDLQVGENEDLEAEEILEIEELDSEPYVRRPIYSSSSLGPLNRPMLYTLTSGFSDEDLDVSETAAPPLQCSVPSNSPEEGKHMSTSEDQISELIRNQLNNLAQEESRLKWMQDVLNNQSYDFNSDDQFSTLPVSSVSVQELKEDSVNVTDVIIDEFLPECEDRTVQKDSCETSVDNMLCSEEEIGEEIIIEELANDDENLEDSHHEYAFIAENAESLAHSQQAEDDSLCPLPERGNQKFKELSKSFHSEEVTERRNDNECNLMPESNTKETPCLEEDSDAHVFSSHSPSENDKGYASDLCNDKNYENILEENVKTILSSTVMSNPDKQLDVSTLNILYHDDKKSFLNDVENSEANCNQGMTNNLLLSSETCNVETGSFDNLCIETDIKEKLLSLENTNESAADQENESFVKGINEQVLTEVLPSSKNENSVHEVPASVLKVNEVPKILNNSEHNIGDLGYFENGDCGIPGLPKELNISESIKNDEICLNGEISVNTIEPVMTDGPEVKLDLNMTESNDKSVNEASLYGKSDDSESNHICEFNVTSSSVHEESGDILMSSTQNTKVIEMNLVSPYQESTSCTVFDNALQMTDTFEGLDNLPDSNAKYDLQTLQSAPSVKDVTPDLVSSEILPTVENLNCDETEKSINSSKYLLQNNIKKEMAIEKFSSMCHSECDRPHDVDPSHLDLEFTDSSTADNVFPSDISIKSSYTKAHSSLTDLGKENSANKCRSSLEESSAIYNHENDSFKKPIDWILEMSADAYKESNSKDDMHVSSEENRKLDDDRELSAHESVIPKIVITPASESEVEDELEEYLREQLEFYHSPSSEGDFSVTSQYSVSPFEDVFGSYHMPGHSSDYIEAFNFEFDNGIFFEDYSSEASGMQFESNEDLSSENLMSRKRSSSLPHMTENTVSDENLTPKSDSSLMYDSSKDTTHL